MAKTNESNDAGFIFELDAQSIKKAAAHVVQTNTDSFPPSMGKIIQTMKDYMGTASLRTAKIDSCSRCSDGFRRLVFWIKLEPGDQTTQKREMNASCSECEKGASRKTNLKLLYQMDKWWWLSKSIW